MGQTGRNDILRRRHTQPVSAESIDRLLSGVRSLLRLQPEAEITLEANPGTFEIEKFQGFKDAGITRLSIGVQSF